MTTESVDIYLERVRLERMEGWGEKVAEIPWINFPSEWKVKVIPPFRGAIARFLVELPSGDSKSIYLDFDNRLGYYGGPYWEVYPVGDDVGRCSIEDVTTLLDLISDVGN